MRFNCSQLMEALDSRRFCEETDDGLKIGTHCLYPSADQVFVYVAALGDGFRVTDGGGVSRSVLVHGRDDYALDAGLKEASNLHALRVENGILIADVPNREWLPAAVAAVANGASLAAAVAVDHVSRRSERSLAAKILESIAHVVPEQFIAREFEYRGKSGKAWKLDYAILRDPNHPILLKAVTPHHNSISSNYTTFGDIGDAVVDRFCIYQRNLARDDAALIRQVAVLAPVTAVEVGVRDALHRLH